MTDEPPHRDPPPAVTEPASPPGAAGAGSAERRAKPFARHLFSQLGRRGRAGLADYAYQIVIVILGVFLGITFEGMASERERTASAHAALDRLVADLRRDEADMARILEHQRGQQSDFEAIAAWLDTARAGESARVDSLLGKVVTSLTVYPRRGAYTSMINSAQVGLLPPDLANGIVNLYENVYARLAANGEHYDNSLERDFLPSYAHAWDPVRKGLISDDPADRVRFRNHALLMRAWSSYYSDVVAQSRVVVAQIVAEIERTRGR